MLAFTPEHRETIKRNVLANLKQVPDPHLPPALVESKINEAFDIALAAFAEIRMEAQREALDIRKTEGKCPGRSPGYGFAYRGKRGHRRKVINPEQREVLDTILVWREEGFTCEAISAALAANKIKSPRGKRWSHSQIARAAQRAAAFRVFEQERIDRIAKIGPPKSSSCAVDGSFAS